MISIEQHLSNNRAQIVSEAHEYAKSYKCSFAEAYRDVESEYIQGYCESEEAGRSGDWDYGQE